MSGGLGQLNSVSVHGAVLDSDEQLTRLVARLQTLCVAFGAPLDAAHSVHQQHQPSNPRPAATSAAPSELRIVQAGGSTEATLCWLAQRQSGGPQAQRATVCGVAEVALRGGGDAAFVAQLGFAPAFRFRRVGLQGVAYAGQFKLLVSLYRIVSAAGALVPPADVWLLEIETVVSARLIAAAVDALYLWAVRLYPIVEVGTIDQQAFIAARQSVGAAAAAAAAAAATAATAMAL